MFEASFREYLLKFKFPAGTSRGILYEKKTWFLILKKETTIGIGECSLIPGLSPDDRNNYIKKLTNLCEYINRGNNPLEFDLNEYPSICFGLEMALKDIDTGGKRILFPSDFTNGKNSIPINGLVWMGSKEFMKKQIKDKVEAGFTCLKLKIGALDFFSESEILNETRKEFPGLEIRLDANGALHHDEAISKLNQLSKYRIHSLEQPIKPGNHEQMAEICEKSPIPIALDEELIGISNIAEKRKLLKTINPAFIILKPSLIGGFGKAEEWKNIAKETGTGWWVTSALESNIGLNAIAQWVYTLNSKMVQGLGTGQLYENNLPSPLVIRKNSLYHKSTTNWDLNIILA
jgi:o-succinylbenzoate synthase